MRRARRRRLAGLAVALLALAGAACIPPVDGGGAPCPCDSAHECCPTVEQDQCVPLGQLAQCKIAAECALPDGKPPDFTLLAGSPDGTAGTPLPPGGVLPLYFGLQGGFHVYVQIAMERMDPRALSVSRRLLDPQTGAQLRSQAETLTLQCEDGAWQLGQGQLTFICPSGVAGVAVEGRDLTLEVTLSDPASGASLTKRFTIHPVCQPSQPHYDECTGAVPSLSNCAPPH